MKGKYFSNLFLVGVVAVVSIVVLFLHGNGITGTNTFQETCIDTDDANDQYEYGTVTYGTLELPDKCYGGLLQQWRCNPNNWKPLSLPTRRCPDDRCENGACLRP